MKTRKNRKRKKRALLLLASAVILTLIIIIIVIVFLILKKKNLDYESTLTIEAGDLLPTITDFVKDKDYKGTIVWKDLDDDNGKVYKPGTYLGTFTYKEEEKTITLNVQDTTKPTIEGVKDIEMLAYEEKPDLTKEITIKDNSNEEIKVLVTGDCDTTKAGKCSMTYEATDASGNTAKENFYLIVKDNPNIKESKTSKGYTITTKYGITKIGDVIIANKTYSLPSTYVPSNLVTINGYVKVIDYVAEAFNKLKSDATSLGLNIYASSGYRSYSDQKYIYNNYVARDGQKEADTYSARAGYSEHQTGLAIDVNTIDMTFDNTSESNFLKENCYKYGFVIRYPKGKDNITGYMYEPWHIRYVGTELATKLYNNGDWITFEEYYGIDSKYN